MSEMTAPTQVGWLLLTRLLVAGDKGATGAEIRKALEPLIGHRWAGAALTERLAKELSDLGSAGLVSLTRKGKTERGALTTEGRRRALELLGLDHPPSRITWDKLKKTYIAALALGLPAPKDPASKSFAGEPGFKAALLKAQYGLPLVDYPKIQDALDALAWTLLGFEPGPKFDAKTVQAALIIRELGGRREAGPKPDPGKEVAKLLARDVGARQSGKDELRSAAIRRWVDGSPVVSVPSRPVGASTVSHRQPSAAQETSSLDLGTFARRVVEAARSSHSGRFGENKVFVAHVWRALRDDPAFAAMGPDGFKLKVAEANNARLLDLSRADMVEAMDPEDVRLSEVHYLGATFHFVRI